MKKPQFNKAKFKREKYKYLRALIQLLFFIFLPSAFSTAFAAIKNIFTSMGQHRVIEMNSLVIVLISLCAFTIVFGRFFCGYACAFGALGDAVRALYVFICKKLKKKPFTLSEKAGLYLKYIKYLVLFAIVIACYTGVYSKTSGYSPWDVFSMLRAGTFRPQGYILGIILLGLILVLMAVSERAFCKFLCPMGAVFSFLPVIPLFSVRRKKADCARGCTACHKVCPSDLDLPEKGSWKVSGECFECKKCVNICPKKNASCGAAKFRGNEIWFTVAEAAALALTMVLAGV